MAQKSLREFDGKRILNRHGVAGCAVASVSRQTDSESIEDILMRIEREHPWVKETKLVVKPDVLIKRRGKSGLILLNADFSEAADWLRQRFEKDIEVEGVTGNLSHFVIEPFLPHEEKDEYYVCISSNREGEKILFYHEGGVNVGDVDAKAETYNVTADAPDELDQSELQRGLVHNAPSERRAMLAAYIAKLFHMYRTLHFVYCEINPLVVVGSQDAARLKVKTDGEKEAVVPLDLAAKIDEAASYLVGPQWGEIDFPVPFGRHPEPEEQYVHDLDGKTGASLKLTILNRKGRVWTMVAGGGASVVYADTISDLGWGHELANYGEYSGAPSEEMTFEYAKTILKLMTREKLPGNPEKFLIIGGGIANFTDVAKTFKGIIHAIRKYSDALREHNVSIWVRRGGPNYQEGLKIMRELGDSLELPIHVYGPETHITAIVPLALGENAEGLVDKAGSKKERSYSSERVYGTTGIGSDNAADSGTGSSGGAASGGASASVSESKGAAESPDQLFTPRSRSIVFGMQTRAVQGMLDFDYLCRRDKPSVAAMVFPFSGNHYQKFYWGKEEFMVPVYSTTQEALEKHQDVSIFVNFASFRSAYSTSMEALEYSQIKVIAVIAEGVPEQFARRLIKLADSKGVLVIGPATVGGIRPGCFRIGNTGGMIDNLVASKLYRSGSVGYVSKSGGMSNELNNIMARYTNGVCEGVAIGGDRYPGSRFIEHLERYEADPSIKMLVLLGEVGGVDEYEVCRAIEDGRITKPVVAWCIGTCAKVFPFEVQFGHAGALANSASQTADAKNEALEKAGAIVPNNFNDFARCIQKTYLRLCDEGTIVPQPEKEPPRVPMDYAWAQQLGLIRKPSSFVSSISDERGEELSYGGMPISQIFQQDVGLGGVISLLWFQRRLPDYATKFIEMVLMVTADHGPAVSGAHNTIVASRAGKDLVSSLCSGLLTVGPRFGGALDEAAEMFSRGYDSNMNAQEFVSSMRKQNKLIMGIGHRIKNVHNPDKRVTIVVDYAKENFPETPVLDFALDVEKITTSKKANLILNVDGAIAACFVDLLRSCGAFTKEEADENIKNGCLNGLFVLGRSIGFIGHYLDQKRLKQGLYRHPWDDISYLDANDPSSVGGPGQ
eukprot:gb/GECG01009495.1/.p1 GENE.gb/GECG01009495.1/~~gb/GECG01009495.1/.p1  ORF type:complete len:1123 (+),score=136.34 gb/GECG01009495.1/:1-3369(+)